MYVIVFISGCVSGYVVVGVCRCLWSSLVVCGHVSGCICCQWSSFEMSLVVSLVVSVAIYGYL